MTRINFYVLQSQKHTARLEFMCRLAEKIYHKGHRILLHTDDARQAEDATSVTPIPEAEVVDQPPDNVEEESVADEAIVDTEQAKDERDRNGMAVRQWKIHGDLSARDSAGLVLLPCALAPLRAHAMQADARRRAVDFVIDWQFGGLEQI